MARTLDPVANAVRRDAILDVTERLIRTKGYDEMSIQDLQDELDVSRGAIYHYFDSKEALLTAVVERMADQAIAVIGPIVDDPACSAPEKLQAVFAAGGRWKMERSGFVLALLRSWYADRNDLVRLRLTRAGAARLIPVLARILRQGVAEGTLRLTSPEHTAAILVALLYDSGDRVGELVLAHLDGHVSRDEAGRTFAAYEEAIERVLGLPAGSFEIIDASSMRVWFG